MSGKEGSDPVLPPYRSGAIEDPRLPLNPYSDDQQPWPGLAEKMDPQPDHGEESYKGHNRLKGKRALITGGDSGIGRAAAIAFAREGADVAINYHPDEESDAQTVVKLIEAEGRRAVALPADIRDEQAARKVIDDAVKGLGGLEVLVLNAGRQQAQKSIADITSDAFDATIKTNIYAPFWMAQQALPHLKKGASIIVTSSINAFSPSPDMLDYAMTKGAGKVFAQGLAKQLAPKGIRVNAVAPGPFWTALQVSGGQPKEDLPEFGADSVLGRAGQPVEIAPIYVLLASDEASYITGEVYAATGGQGTG
ncbi:SDR family oxidoreductase [Paracoccus sp. (in: a-proteobacteria)]|uniref:SDR family oxidoreductase n=1 Tax=Paracoccus sp. TaxID=267 RepID=UPI0026DFD939|nr:SDR family oxidoreductase [Paracoccus sp. (in: a-proteobacteria)]MDO5370192.1 SDR family oxidoreductase [Paracoccus sp. (in: a-proteobacteria)]